MNVEELMMKLYLLGWEKEEAMYPEIAIYKPPGRLKKGVTYITFNLKTDGEGEIETIDGRYAFDMYRCSKTYADIAATLDREGFND